MERRYFSLTGCYTVLTLLGMLLLTYAYPVLLDDRLDGSGAMESLRAAASVFLERMHRTWFFFVVFAAVWLVVLLWILMERRGRQLPFNMQEVYWMGWMSLSVFSAAVLYGMGTNGILTRRFPRSVMVSDVVAVGFMLALPVVAWSRLQRQQKEVEMMRNSVEEMAPPYRAGGILGLNEGSSGTHLVERRAAWQEAAAAAEQNESTAVAVSATPPVIEARGIEQPVPVAVEQPAANSVAGFREHLSALNESWQRIEKIGQEIEQWFDEQRRQAIAQLELHPGLRKSTGLPSDFPAQKLAAVDAEWAQIRKASQALNRWLEERS
jgi:hypothetical protein